ncbi:MAG: AI-2E family transporter [Cloacibacterium sp.]|nr:AI-2E family transporter [Cloacibacterium sp.]
MPDSENQISNNKIKQVFMLVIILALVFLILFNLRDFLPSLLGAITLYIICRNYYFKLVEGNKWKSWLAALFIMLVSLLIIIVPVYFLVNSLISKISNSQEYVGMITDYAEKIHQYIKAETGYDILKSVDIKKIGEWITQYSSTILNTTVNTLTAIASSYFILYFLLINGRLFEKSLMILVPLKNSNLNKIGEKFSKMVIANAIGIPIIALGQGLTLLIGYLIFEADSPIFLFALTCLTSVIPIVGASIVYIPVALMMLASGNTTGAIGIIAFGAVSGMIDNLFRFTFLKKLEDIHPLNSVFGIILGLKVFGFIGLIFGPILVSITLLLIQVYRDEFSETESGKDKILTQLEEITETSTPPPPEEPQTIQTTDS